MTSGYDKLAELREKASPGPYTPQRIIGTPEDVHRRQATENLKALSPVLAEVIGELREALEREIERGEHGLNTEWCEVHESKASPDRYHDDRCIASTHSGDCRFAPRLTAAEALTNTDKKLGDALQPDREERR